MITLVEAQRYRRLRDISQALDHFRILVGPNASGKSTFLDVLRFIKDVLTLEVGVARATAARADDPRDLLWNAQGDETRLAVEVQPPEELVPGAPAPLFRYELAIGVPEFGAAQINAEALWFFEDARERAAPPGSGQRSLFPKDLPLRPSMLELDSSRRAAKGRHKVVAKVRNSGKDYYQWRPAGDQGKAWNQVVSIGRSQAALAFLPLDGQGGSGDHYAAPRWVLDLLARRTIFVQLDVSRLRRPCPPDQRGELIADGSNLAWCVHDLREKAPERFADWLAHVRTALPDAEDIETRVRDEDRHCVLSVRYRAGARVPTWLVSDGTLRLLALTYLAYHRWPGPSVLMIEEPENGIHPGAMDCVLNSLSSMWRHQVLLATHSPVLLAAAQPSDVLCFAAAPSGGTDIVRGEDHPGLRDWSPDLLLGELNAAGVLA